MSDLKVVDSHFHVWNLDTQSLPWLDGTDGTITHTYKVEDLEAEYARQAGVEFVGGVYVWLLHPANANTRPKAATQHRANFNTRFIRAFPSNRTVHAFRPRTMHAVQQRPVLGAIGRKALEASLDASSS